MESPESRTSTMKLFTGDYIAQNVSIGFARFLPAELQGIGAKSSEDQWAWGTGCAQSEWWPYSESERRQEIKKYRA